MGRSMELLLALLLPMEAAVCEDMRPDVGVVDGVIEFELLPV